MALWLQLLGKVGRFVKSSFLVTFSSTWHLCDGFSSLKNKRDQKGELKENPKTLLPKLAVFIRILITEDMLTHPPNPSPFKFLLNPLLPLLFYTSPFAFYPFLTKKQLKD